jgi:hypothetical protein
VEAEAAQDRTAAKSSIKSNEKKACLKSRLFLFVSVRGISLSEDIAKNFHRSRSVQYDIGYAGAPATTVLGAKGLICINCRGFPVCVYSEKPIQVARGLVQCLPTLARPFPGSSIVRLIRTPVVCEEKGSKWLATRREEQCSENMPER